MFETPLSKRSDVGTPTLLPTSFHGRTTIVVLLTVALLSTGCISAKRTPNLQHIFAEAR
jgi:hypothetical protein